MDAERPQTLQCSASWASDHLTCKKYNSNTPFTRYNRLSIRLYNWFDNHVERRAVHSTRLSNRLYNPVWQPVWQPTVERTATVRSTVLNEQLLFIQPVVKPGCTTGCIHDTAVCQTGCQTGLTTGSMFVYTIQPVVKTVWQPVDNRLYRVNGA